MLKKQREKKFELLREEILKNVSEKEHKKFAFLNDKIKVIEKVKKLNLSMDAKILFAMSVVYEKITTNQIKMAIEDLFKQ